MQWNIFKKKEEKQNALNNNSKGMLYNTKKNSHLKVAKNET